MINYFKNLWHKFIDWKRDYFDSPYCKECKSCGEEGCCSIEKSLLGHDCKYGECYAKEVYYNKMIIDEFHNLLTDMGVQQADETGYFVIDPIGDVYKRAFERMEEKYNKPKPSFVITDSSNLDACF
jgi:hypothetical protein